jgi:hypothetical protein
MPVIKPVETGAPEANATPMHNGMATKKTTSDAGKSRCQCRNVNPASALVFTADITSNTHIDEATSCAEVGGNQEGNYDYATNSPSLCCKSFGTTNGAKRFSSLEYENTSPVSIL